MSMSHTNAQRFDTFYKRGDPTKEHLVIVMLRHLTSLKVWPCRGETNFWMLNKRSLAVLALALDLPIPGSSEWTELLHPKGD